jgi:hypothetical protein
MLVHTSIPFLRVAVISASVALSQVQIRATTYDAVVKGRTCTKGKVEAGQQDCEYVVGKGLRFSIAGVGAPDAGIVFSKSDIEGDYYAVYGLQTGCVAVWPGKANNATPLDLAFVSPRSGNVYRDWKTCSMVK